MLKIYYENYFDLSFCILLPVIGYLNSELIFEDLLWGDYLSMVLTGVGFILHIAIPLYTLYLNIYYFKRDKEGFYCNLIILRRKLRKEPLCIEQVFYEENKIERFGQGLYPFIYMARRLLTTLMVIILN